MTKNNLKLIPYFLFFLALSFIIELLVFNFQILFLDDNSQGIIELKTYFETSEEEQKIININIDNLYVNKLNIEYQIEEDIPVIITYIEKDYYDNDKVSQIEDILDNETDISITNLKNKISNIKITYDTTKNINIQKISIDNELKINYYRILFIFTTFLLISLLIYFYKNKDCQTELHQYFILIGLIIGTLTIILQPSATYYSWDDQIHFLNTYELKGGNIDWSIGEFSMIDSHPIGRYSIDSKEEQINQMNYLNIEELTNYTTYGARLITYNKIAYIPSAIGYHLCNLLNLPFTICFKIGKLMNLITYLLIMGYAIKISKIGQRLLTVIGLLPTNLFLACQYAYDPAVTSGITLALVIIINILIDKESKINFKQIAIFLFAMLYGILPKAVYAPLLLIALLISKEKFVTRKQCLQFKVGIIIICLLTMSTFILPTVTSDVVAGDSRGGETSVSEQLSLILEHPIGYVKVLKNTMIDKFFISYIGRSGLTNYAYIGEINYNLYYITLVLLLFVSITDTSFLKLKKFNRLFIIFLTLSVIILIWTALYLSFTPVGLNTINGVQPRYFLPLLFPLIISLQSNKIKNNITSKFYNTLILSITSLVLLISIYEMILKVYCF